MKRIYEDMLDDLSILSKESARIVSDEEEQEEPGQFWTSTPFDPKDYDLCPAISLVGNVTSNSPMDDEIGIDCAERFMDVIDSSRIVSSRSGIHISGGSGRFPKTSIYGKQ